MKGLVLFFYRYDDVLINLFFILFFTMTVLNNTDNLTVAIIFGLVDIGFIVYTLGRIFGMIRHYPRIKIEGDNIIYKGFYGKTIFPAKTSDYTRSTSMGGIIDIIKVHHPEKNKHKSIFLTDLEPELRKKILSYYQNN